MNAVEGGFTPILPLSDFSQLGFSTVLYANTAMRAAITAMTRTATALLKQGDSLGLAAEIASWDERQAIVRKDHFDELDLYYGSFS